MASDDPTRWLRRIPSEDELKDYEDQAREQRRLRFKHRDPLDVPCFPVDYLEDQQEAARRLRGRR